MSDVEKLAREWLQSQVENQRFVGDFRPDHIKSLVELLTAFEAKVRAEAKPLVDVVKRADKMKMYQPVGCTQYRREMKELLTAAEDALRSGNAGERT